MSKVDSKEDDEMYEYYPSQPVLSCESMHVASYYSKFPLLVR